jgi:hypothetical protein
MKENRPIIMTTLGLAVLFGLIYKLRQQGATAKEIKLIHNAVEKNIAETVAVHRTLRRTRGAVNQIHQYLEPPVTKGVKKAAS